MGMETIDQEEEEVVHCINCNNLVGLICGLDREEDFIDGKGCLEFIPWWKA